MISDLSAAAPQFFELIAARTGLSIRAKDRAVVERALAERMRVLGLECAQYLALLTRESGDAPEWRALAPILTNGESYFWRDRGQFELLGRIIPELWRARAGSKAGLRVWSAGCSSGEETYSLAMLTRERLSARACQSVSILGTDLNEEALGRARRGFYGDWSFRGVDEARRARHFERADNGWQIHEELRAMTSFKRHNLAQAPTEKREFDLIVCRNVLIYFAPAAIDAALAAFADALCQGGYLLTGHAELTNRNLSGLTPRLRPESVIYQKAPAATQQVSRVTKAVAPKAVAAKTVAPKAVAPKTTATKAVVAAPQTDFLELAHSLADAGRYEAAVARCRAAIERDGCDADAYLLWARIEIEREQDAIAKTLLKKVVYLAPGDGEGFRELAALYEREGDAARAQTMRAAAAAREAAGG